MAENKTTVYVSGEKLTLLSDMDEKYVKETAEKVDTKIRSIQGVNPTVKKEKAIILACLDYCDDGRRIQKECEDLRRQMKDYLMSIDSEKEKSASLKREVDVLKQKLLSMQGDDKKEDPKKTVVAVGKVKEDKKNDIVDGAVQQRLF